MPIVLKSGSLKPLEPSGPVQALPLPSPFQYIKSATCHGLSLRRVSIILHEPRNCFRLERTSELITEILFISTAKTEARFRPLDSLKPHGRTRGVFGCGFYIYYGATAPPVDQGLLVVEDSRSHSETPHSVGLLWTSDQPDAETSTCTTHKTRDKHPCPRRDSNPQSHQTSDRRPTP